MNTNKFKVGDVVQTKDKSGPLMTVQHTYHDGSLSVLWFDADDNLHTGHLHSDVVNLVDMSPKKAQDKSIEYLENTPKIE